jgi:Rrf2 family protein
MKLNTRARYALTAMAAISRRSGGDGPASVRWLGRRTRISRYYLGHILTRLAEAGLLRSQRGRKGGFSLALPAEAIGLGQIVEAAVGPINIVECVGNPDLCLLAEVCQCRGLYERINERILAALNQFSLAELASQHELDAGVAAKLLDGAAIAGENEPQSVPCHVRGIAG